MISLASPAIVRSASARLLLGWREWLALPELGVTCIRAKVDSGARSSALHVQEQELFERDGRPFVRFALNHGWRDDLRHMVETEVIDQRAVTDSGGHRKTRVFIRSLMRLPNGQSWPIEINLTQRRNMLFPMLLGRTALRRRCLVEPARSYLLGTPTTEQMNP
ncbi:MAG: RimK/LysX family protein [Arenimonas sp.]